MAADKSELRQLAPSHLLQALDAIAMAKGMERHAYIEAVLTADQAYAALSQAAIKVHGAFAHPCLSESSGAPQ